MLRKTYYAQNNAGIIGLGVDLRVGPGLLCQHNFEHNRSLKALSIMLA